MRPVGVVTRLATRAAAGLTFAFAFAFALAVALALEAGAQPAAGAELPSFEVSLDRATAAVGDRIVATYSARMPEGARIEVEALVSPQLDPAAHGENPALKAGRVFEFEAPLAETKKAEAGGVVWTLRVPFVAFAPGELPVLGPRLVYVSPGGARAAARPKAATLTVAPRLPNQPTNELAPKPDKPPLVPARSVWFWLSLAALALAVAGGVWALLRRKRPGAAGAAETPALAPGEELLAALATLSKDAERLGSDARDFYSRLTRAAKRYLERRLDVPVLEWTTFETLRRLRDGGLEPPRELGLAELLGAADRVKFARAGSTRDEARRHLERARALHDHFEAEAARRAAEAAAQAASQTTARVAAPAAERSGGRA